MRRYQGTPSITATVETHYPDPPFRLRLVAASRLAEDTEQATDTTEAQQPDSLADVQLSTPRTESNKSTASVSSEPEDPNDSNGHPQEGSRGEDGDAEEEGDEPFSLWEYVALAVLLLILPARFVFVTPRLRAGIAKYRMLLRDVVPIAFR